MTATLAVVAVLLVAALARRQAPSSARRRLSALGAMPDAGRVAAPAWFAHLVRAGLRGRDPERAWVAARLGAATVVTAALVMSVALGAAAAGVLLALPSVLGRIDDARRRRRRDLQLVESLERLAGDLRAGIGLRSALEALGERTPDPLGVELRTLGDELRHGAGLVAALDRWALGSSASADVRLAAAALALGAEAGGPLARTVDQVAGTVRERRELRAEVRALAAQARASAAVLAVAPLAFTALVAVADPAVRRFLTASPLGVGCLLGGLALEGLGAAWSTRILGRDV